MDPNKKNSHSLELKRKFKLTLAVTEGILPYTETPGCSKYESDAEVVKDEIRAPDLFALFTANIIKEETLFIR